MRDNDPVPLATSGVQRECALSSFPKTSLCAVILLQEPSCSYPSLTEEFSCHPKLMCTCASAFQVIWFAKRSAISINKRPKRMSYVMCLLLCFNMSFLFFYLSCAFGYTKYVRYRKLLLKYVPAVLLWCCVVHTGDKKNYHDWAFLCVSVCPQVTLRHWLNYRTCCPVSHVFRVKSRVMWHVCK